MTTIPLGMCLSTTQLLVLLVACPPGPDPLTNCSSSSSSFRAGKSARLFLPAAKTQGTPGGSGLGSGVRDLLHRTRLDTLYIQLMNGTSRDIPSNEQNTAFLRARRVTPRCTPPNRAPLIPLTCIYRTFNQAVITSTMYCFSISVYGQGKRFMFISSLVFLNVSGTVQPIRIDFCFSSWQK